MTCKNYRLMFKATHQDTHNEHYHADPLSVKDLHQGWSGLARYVHQHKTYLLSFSAHCSPRSPHSHLLPPHSSSTPRSIESVRWQGEEEKSVEKESDVLDGEMEREQSHKKTFSQSQLHFSHETKKLHEHGVEQLTYIHHVVRFQ